MLDDKYVVRPTLEDRARARSLKLSVLGHTAHPQHAGDAAARFSANRTEPARENAGRAPHRAAIEKLH